MVERPAKRRALGHFLGWLRCSYVDHTFWSGSSGRGSFAGLQVLPSFVRAANKRCLSIRLITEYLTEGLTFLPFGHIGYLIIDSS